jgi:hypothetical protein
MKQVKRKTKAGKKKPKSGRKQPSKTPKTGSAKTLGEGSTLGRESPPAVRFSATIHASEQTERAVPNWMETLTIDRIPDPTGLIRALVTPADCVRLVNQGFEVRLSEAYPVKPLDPALIESQESFKSWLDQRLQTFKRATKKKGPKGT